MNFTKLSLLRSIPIVLALAVLSAAAVSAQAAGASNPVDAVRAMVRSLATPESAQDGCSTLTGRLADCPITGRLRARLQSPVAGVETGNLVSRSQNPPRSVEVAQVKLAENATEAHINTRWEYGTSRQRFEYTITFVVRKEAGGWLVDDTHCLDDPATSVYNQPVGPCPVSGSTSTGAVPGMPRTGVAGGADYILPFLMGLAAVGSGLLLLARGRRLAS